MIYIYIYHHHSILWGLASLEPYGIIIYVSIHLFSILIETWNLRKKPHLTCQHCHWITHLGGIKPCKCMSFFSNKNRSKELRKCGFRASKSHVFCQKKHYKFRMRHQKSTHPSPSPQQKNQNPCLTNKIRTTKKPPHLYIYIYIHIFIALRRVQAVAGHFAWSQLCGPQEGLTAADAHGLATRDDATGGRGLRLRQQFGGVRCPEAEASADARSFFGGVGSSAGVGLFWVKFLVNS